MISNAVNTLNFVTELRDWSLHPLTKEKLRGKPFFPGVPHIVILGAGASKAAFPDGDKNGKPLPLLDDLANIVGRTWTDVIKLASPPVTGFEAQFSWIRKCGKFADEIARVEAILFQYFDELEIPDIATIYDYLVLGLRAKDTIATFNWDPLLLLAHRRNRHVAELPDLRFLHGSVAYFTCSDHDVLGSANEGCPICGKFLDPGRLFYPEADKDYAKHAVIHRDWQAVTRQLSKAFILQFSDTPARKRITMPANFCYLVGARARSERSATSKSLTSKVMISSDAAGENLYRITMTWSFRIFGSPQSQSGLAELRITSSPRRFMEYRQNPWGRSAPIHSPNCRIGMPQ
jgi:hypothetical protein